MGVNGTRRSAGRVQAGVARSMTSSRQRIVATKGALWALGLTIVVITFWPTLSVPAQADDLLALFDVAQRPAGTVPGEMARTTTSLLRGFRDGRTAHFYPLGGALEIGLKQTMLRANGLGTTASSVHHAAFLAITVATFVASVTFVGRLRPGAPHGVLGTASYAVPVALGFAACLQVTTPWSTYDPVVVHPVFGAFVTLVGVAFLSAFVAVLNGQRGVRGALWCAVLGLAGVMTYEGFYPFAGVAVVLLVAAAIHDRVTSGRWSLNRPAVWAVVPAVALIAGVRLYAMVRAEPGAYQGTTVGLGLDTVKAWWTSIHTTAPAGSWGRDVSTGSAPATGEDGWRPAALLAVVAAVTVWAVVTRHVGGPQHRSAAAAGEPGAGVGEAHAGHDAGHEDAGVGPDAGHESPTGERGTASEDATIGSGTATDARDTGDLRAPVAASAPRAPDGMAWLPPVAMILACPAVFALSVQWRGYLLRPGNTYMEATSAYWAWAMLVGVAVFLAVSRCRSKWTAVAVLAVALAWAGVQTTVNAAAVRAEIAAPTPFGVDLVRMLDDGTDLDDAARCRLLEMIPQIRDNPGWRLALDSLYAERHGEPFCSA